MGEVLRRFLALLHLLGVSVAISSDFIAPNIFVLPRLPLFSNELANTVSYYSGPEWGDEGNQPAINFIGTDETAGRYQPPVNIVPPWVAFPASQQQDSPPPGAYGSSQYGGWGGGYQLPLLPYFPSWPGPFQYGGGGGGAGSNTQPSGGPQPPPAGAGWSGDQISEQCIHAICMQESKCNVNQGCIVDNDGVVDPSQYQSCGPFQIKQMYWSDCKDGANPIQPQSWQACTLQYQCAVNCVKNYVIKYWNNPACRALQAQGPAGECEVVAKIHNTGPQGCSQSSPTASKANNYWTGVQQNLQQSPG